MSIWMICTPAQLADALGPPWNTRRVRALVKRLGIATRPGKRGYVFSVAALAESLRGTPQRNMVALLAMLEPENHIPEPLPS